MSRLRILLLTLLLTSYSHISPAGSPPTTITIHTIEGQTITPLEAKKGSASVVIFITSDCPIANALAPEINRIYSHYQKQGVQFTLAHVDPERSNSEALLHAAQYNLLAPIVIDRQHLLVKASKATITPQVAVFDAAGKLVYTGRINNQWADYGKRRVKATRQELRETLDALLSGKPLPKSSATAIGCYIPDLE